MKTTVVHKDVIGRELKVGDAVAYALRNVMCVGIVAKLNPKMVRIKALRKILSNDSDEINQFSSQCVLIDGADVTLYLLQQR